MTRREWWIWRGIDYDIDSLDRLYSIGPMSELYPVEVDDTTDRVVRAWGPIARWHGRGPPPVEILPWERVFIAFPRPLDNHGRRLPGNGAVVPLCRLMLASEAVVGVLETRRTEFECLEVPEATTKKSLTATRSGLRLSSVG